MSKLSLNFARALADEIGDDASTLTRAADELATIAATLGDATTSVFLGNIAIASTDKAAAIRAVLTAADAHPAVVATVTIAITHGGKAQLIAHIANNFKTIVEQQTGIITATIASATPLSKTQLAELTAALKTMTGKEVHTETTEDTSLIGGVRVTVGGDVIDLSLAGRLARLAQAI